MKKNNNVNWNNYFRKDSSLLHIYIKIRNVYSAIFKANVSQNAILVFLLVEICEQLLHHIMCHALNLIESRFCVCGHRVVSGCCISCHTRCTGRYKIHSKRFPHLDFLFIAHPLIHTKLKTLHGLESSDRHYLGWPKHTLGKNRWSCSSDGVVGVDYE